MADPATEWTAGELKARLDRGEPFFVLDVRNRDEFGAFRIEGRTPLPSVNTPYFELLELGGKDDLVGSIVAYVERELAGTLPRELPVLAVCAKGGTSEYVARALRRLGYAAANLRGGIVAWGDHYDIRPVAEDGALALYQVSRPGRGCLSYVWASAGRAVVIDTLRHHQHYLDLARARGLTIEAVVDTHAHADHLSGGPALAAAVGCPYYLHPYDGIHPIDVLPARIAYEPLREGQVVGELRVLHVPGHTLGSVALCGDSYLFTGDSMFIGSIGRPDLGGRGEAWAPLLQRSLQRLMELPAAIRVLPGHFSRLEEADGAGVFVAPLGELRRRNEGLLRAGEERERFVRYILDSTPRFPPEYVEIKRVNAGLRAADEHEASVLELGKNLCALGRTAQ
jgi:glyoxylase-like metal-dependent hydrolase (beta-lactamase superfamily II)